MTSVLHKDRAGVVTLRIDTEVDGVKKYSQNSWVGLPEVENNNNICNKLIVQISCISSPLHTV